MIHRFQTSRFITIHHNYRHYHQSPKRFPNGTVSTETFDFITNKKLRYSRFFVYHEIHSKIKFTALKFGNHNIISTFQPLNTWLNINRFYTLREASIRFLKDISTGLTFQHISKNIVTSALINVDLTEKDIISLQKTTEKDVFHNHNNKHKPDEQLKDASEN